MIPRLSPPPRVKEGTPTSLTPMDEIEVWSWYQAKRALGSQKTLAAKLGLTERAVSGFIALRLKWERGERV